MTHFNPKTNSLTVETPRFHEGSHSQFILPTRMGFRWRHFNHRIAIWKFNLAQNGGDHPWADELRAHSLGGPFSEHLGKEERPRLKYGFDHVTADSVDQLGAARRKLNVIIDSSGIASGTRRFDREELCLSGYQDVVAVITGFGFDTSIPQNSFFPSGYHPAHGYLTRGLGGRVAVTEITDREIEISYWLRYGFGAAMDRPRHNEALLDARVGGELDLALLGTSEVPIQRGDVHYELEYDEPAIAVQQPIDPAPKRLQRIRLDGKPSAPAGLYGIQAFNFELTPHTSCEWNRNWPLGDQFRGEHGEYPKCGAPGYYIRELTVDLRREHFSPATGEATFLFDGYASNSTLSIPFHRMRSEFSGSMVWLQADVTTDSISFDSEFSTGASAFALADMG